MSGSLFVVPAPSGAGKTSLVRAVVNALAHVVVSVSHTTRACRASEAQDVSYHFVDQFTFQDMIERGDFLEHARVYDHDYGTSRHWVLQQLQSGLDVILEIDCQGALQVKSAYEDVTLIFVLPPSRAELKRRLIARQQNTQQDLIQRMGAVSREVALSAKFDYLVVNAEFDQAVADIVTIIRAERLSYRVQSMRYCALLDKY